MFYLIALVAFCTSLISTYAVRRLALFFDIVDRPDTERKFHRRAVPLLGGLALFGSFWLIVGVLLVWHPIVGLAILTKKLVATFLGSLVLMVVGVYDDIRGMSARTRLLITALVVLLTIIGGVEVKEITNPFGGSFNLAAFQPVLHIGTLVSFLWLMGVMYTTKIVDGLDGLATGIVAVGSLMIFLLTQSSAFFQPNVSLLSLIFLAVCLGFLWWNFFPARIFLGESGSLFVGFMLGVLSIIAGSKIATAFLVLAIPILDLARVIYMRLKNKQPIFKGDRRHLHYSLIDKGFTERQVVFIFYTAAALFGSAALILQSYGKMVVIALLLLLSTITALYASLTSKQ